MALEQSEYQTIRIPLVGSFTIREFDFLEAQDTSSSSGTIGVGVIGNMIIGKQNLLTKDQRFVNFIPTQVTNQLTEKKTFYLVKRPGFALHTTPAPGKRGKYILYWGSRNAGPAIVSAFGDTTSNIYQDTTDLGAITGECTFLQEVLFGLQPAFVAQSNDNSLWFSVENMLSSFVGDTTASSTTISNITSTVGIYVGQEITGSGIPANTRVASVSTNSITITNAATATASGVTFNLSKLAKVIDADYPGNLGKTMRPGCAFLDGYLFVMDSDGVVYNSDLNSLSAWSANASIQSLSYPDKGVTLVRYRNTIAAFNTTSTEFFSDAGNPSGTPLINNTQSTMRIGAANPYAVASTEDVLVWASSTDQGGSAVYMLDGYNPVKISTPIIEQQIALAGASNTRVDIARLFGRTMAFVILPQNTYVYSFEDKMWHEWKSNNNYWDFLTVAYVGANNIYGISIGSSPDVLGKIWIMDVQNVRYQDNGSNYTATVQTQRVDFNNNKRKRLHRLEVIGDSKTSTSPILISWSDDDYKTFSSGRQVDMANSRAYINNCGEFRRRAFKLDHTSNTGLRLEALELDIVQGIS